MSVSRKEKMRKNIKFFYPLGSLLVFVAGWNSCKAGSFLSDILILLGLWLGLFLFCWLLVLYPGFFDDDGGGEK